MAVLFSIIVLTARRQPLHVGYTSYHVWVNTNPYHSDVKYRIANKTTKMAKLSAYRRAYRLTPEEKYRIIPLSSSGWSTIPNTWKEIALEQIVQGTDVTQRIGDRIAVTGIEISGVMTGGQTGTVADDPYNAVRFVFGVWDGYNNQTPLLTGGQTISSALDKTICRGLNQVLFDKTIALESPNSLSTGYQPAVKTFTWSHRFGRPLEITYNGTTTGSANKTVNLGAISDSTLVPNPGFVLGYIKVMFMDN